MRVGFAVAVLAACVAKWGRNYVRRVFSTAAGSSYTPVDVGGPSEAMVEVRQIKSGETSDDPDSAAERGASPPVTPTSKPKKKKPSKKVKLPTTPDTSDALSPTPTATSTSSLPSTLGHTSLSSLTVGDEVLGYGSHGTVVYKGTFQGRDVAVKRLLLDFYEVADHEVRMLQESDDHPNVVRYFYREKAKGFMYIALELCPASLADVIEKPNDALISALRMRLKPASVLFQIARGLHHLHELKIVHRDIKPQNILVGAHKDSKTGAHPRVLISDFGLGKRLGDDQSSFHHTHHTAGGTVGWRAPECILAQNSFPIPVDASNTTTTTSSFSSSSSSSDSTGNGGGVEPNPAVRITKSIDIFSLGCVFHYVLTAGSHPFGDKFAREINILKGNHRLDKIDTLPESAIEAKDLIRRMIAKDPLKRPTTSHVLIHPFFWPPTKRLNFLADASDRLEIEPRDPPSPLLKMLERGAHKVVGQDWYRRIDRALLDNLGKYRKYDGAVVRDLLRVVRNKKHHYQDLPPDVQHSLGTLPAGFVAYFTSRFPALLMHVYYVVADSRLRNEDMFRVYFQPPE
ncbi:kinase-like domain-containing protein [Fimicolochytrium jonesii]|uniref:kinase-like domain-containing protein n=1 Tax=Fimicolochytrium jonesii TaxID=1396493 RepID=UPI0022FF3A62|nr:kinase-like domain-containing protein [Fimicolochytrium jonesii]KAI8820571.1 kinase-like domain-containing protein [Fimicolochytrium jonesii]